MGASTTVQSLSAGYRPAPNSTDQLHWKITTGVNTAARLGALLTTAGSTYPNGIPALVIPGDINNATRPPRHVIFSIPQGAANPVYVTWDNNTTPVVGGPGDEWPAGFKIKFELCGDSLLLPKAAGSAGYAVNNASAFIFIATAATVILVNFSE